MLTDNKDTYDDMIYRQDALDAFGLSEKTRKWGGDHSGYNTRMLYEIQDELEAIEPAWPKQGKWIISKVNGQYQCSNCGMFTGLTAEDINEGFHLMNYCGNCGSKNIEESKMIETCEMKNENGFCLCSGGVCRLVDNNEEHDERLCSWLRNAYRMGKDPTFKPAWVTADWVKVEGKYLMRCTNCGSFFATTIREDCPDFCFTCHADMRKNGSPGNGVLSSKEVESFKFTRIR